MLRGRNRSPIKSAVLPADRILFERDRRADRSELWTRFGGVTRRDAHRWLDSTRGEGAPGG